MAVVPESVAPPGDAVTVHGVTGKPLKSTFPFAKAQVGCVIEPMVGAAGVIGWELTTALPEASELHPDEFINTVNVCVPAGIPVKLAVAVVPERVAPPGLSVTVHCSAGKPPKGTVAVAVAQLGCVIVPTTGAVGVIGWEPITTLIEAAEVHPKALVTVKV